MSGPVAREDRADVAVLRLAHGKASALDTELLVALGEQLDDVERTEELASVVLTGTGPIFSAGVDLFRVLDGGAAYLEQFLPAIHRTLTRLFAFERPVVAALNGHAVAGGCILALACDHRIMAQGPGTVGVPELPVGVPFPCAALEILRYGAPAERVEELVYLGRTYGARDALARGLVHELVAPERLLDRACEVARARAAVPAATFRLTKRQLRAPALERIARHAAAADAEVVRAWASPAIRRAIEAYVRRTLRH